MYSSLVVICVMLLLLLQLPHRASTNHVNKWHRTALPRIGHKKRGYLCRRQSDAWILSSSSMNTQGGEQMAHNVLASCRGCMHMPKRWGKKNRNESPIEAAGTWFLGQPPRPKHWPSRWWGLGPQGRRSRGYTMRCINKGGWQTPHHMGQSGWKPLTRKSVLLWKSRHSRGGVLPGQKKIYREPLCLFCSPAARLNSAARPKDPHNQALSEAREAYQRALEAAYLLEQNIKRLSWVANRVKSTACQCSYSHSCSRGRPQERCAQSLSCQRPRKHVTFQDQEEETSSREGASGEPWGQAAGGGEVEGTDLGPQPTLVLELEHFLEMPATMWGARDRQDSLPEPSINNYEMWLEWSVHWLDTPNWWEKLTAIPNAGDPKKLAWKFWASFKIPGVRCDILRNHKEYTAPLAPKCIKQGMFLPDNMPHQEI